MPHSKWEEYQRQIEHESGKYWNLYADVEDMRKQLRSDEALLENLQTCINKLVEEQHWWQDEEPPFRFKGDGIMTEPHNIPKA